MAAAIASILSICWFLALALYLAGARTGFTAIDRILTLDPNNFGDFLSGAFAPVAFAWLAYSVVMQSSELALQREEIKETRTVLKAQEVAQRDSAIRAAELSNLSRKQLDLNISISSEKIILNSIKSIKSIIYAFDEMIIKTTNSGTKTIWKIPEDIFSQDDAIMIEILRQDIESFIESTEKDKFEFWIDSENINSKNINNLKVYQQIIDICDYIVHVYDSDNSGIKLGSRLYDNIALINVMLKKIMNMKVQLL